MWSAFNYRVGPAVPWVSTPAATEERDSVNGPYHGAGTA